MRPALRLRQHRGTTANLASLYPFSVQGLVSSAGLFVGIDVPGGPR